MATVLAALGLAAPARAVPLDIPVHADPLVRGQQLLEQQQPNEAVRLLSELVQANPGLLRAHFLLVRAYLVAGKPKAAYENAREALQKDPGNFEGRILAGTALIGMAVAARETPARVALCQNAIAELLRALELRPTDLDTTTLLMRARGLLATLDRSKAAQLKDSVVELQAVLTTAEDPAQVHLDLARVHRDYAKLLLTDEERRTADPKIVQEQLDHYRHALDHYDAAGVMPPDFYRTLMEAAMARTRSGYTDTAIAMVQACLDRAPDAPSKARVYSVLGLTLQEQGRIDDARKAFESAIETDAHAYDAYLRLAEMDAAINEQRRAILRMTRVIDLQPDLLDGYLQLGKLHQEVKEYATAERYYRLALSLDPQQAIVVNPPAGQQDPVRALRLECALRLAEMLMQTGSGHKADLASRMLTDMAPEWPEAHLLRGRILARLMRLDRARESLARALELNADLLDARRELANVWLAEIQRLEEKRDLTSDEKVDRERAYDSSVEQETILLGQNPGDHQQAYWLAYLYWSANSIRVKRSQEDYYRALELLDGILKDQPAAINALVLHADIDEKIDRPQRAAQMLERALAIPADQAVVLIASADERHRERARSAPEEFRASADLEARVHLAHLCVEYLSRVEDGEKLASEALEALPKPPAEGDTAAWDLYRRRGYHILLAAILDTLGWVRLQQGNPQEAEDPIRRSVKLWPTDNSLYHLGAVLFELKQYSDAEKVLAQALAREPRQTLRERIWELKRKCEKPPPPNT